MRLRTGAELAVVNITPLGACVDSAARLLPGSMVEVHLRTWVGRVLVRTRVTRCTVVALHADAVRYRSGLEFERPVDLAAAHPIGA